MQKLEQILYPLLNQCSAWSRGTAAYPGPQPRQQRNGDVAELFRWCKKRGKKGCSYVEGKVDIDVFRFSIIDFCFIGLGDEHTLIEEKRTSRQSWTLLSLLNWEFCSALLLIVVMRLSEMNFFD